MVAICRISVWEEGGRDTGKTRLALVAKKAHLKQLTDREKVNNIDKNQYHSL